MNKKQWIKQTAEMLGITLAQARHLRPIDLHSHHRPTVHPVMAGGLIYEARKRREWSGIIGRPPQCYWVWERQDCPIPRRPYPY